VPPACRFFSVGAAGVAHLFGPSGGYLLGFVPAAYTIGWFAERGWDRHVLRTFAAMAAGSVVLFACGLAQLARSCRGRSCSRPACCRSSPVTSSRCSLAAFLLPGLWKLLERTGLAPRA
jgi:biotin transport system substrate-specific component